MPEEIGEKDQRAGDEGEFSIKKPEADEIPDCDGKQEAEDRGAGDHSVADVDEIGGLELPLGLHHLERDGIHKGRERGLEEVGEVFRGHFLACIFELPDGEGANVFRGKSVACRDLAGDLGLIHRGGGGEAFELNKEIKEGERDDERPEHRDADDGDESALVERVNDVLEAFF